MKKWFLLMAGILLIVLADSALAGAEIPDKPETVSALEEVVVTASRVEEAGKEITANVSVIGQDDIRISSARNLGDLLAERAGINIRKYPGTLTSIGIRGFRTESHGNDLKGHVLVLLNGRRAATGNAAKIMTRNIERIEIIRGPASVQYGSAAVGGVVNVITKRGGEVPEFFVDGTLGSFGYEETAAGFSGKHEVFDFSGSFSRSSMDDYDTGGGDKFKNTGYDEIENISLNLGLEFMPNNRLGIIYTAFEADGVGSSGYLSENDEDDYKDSRNRSFDAVYDGRSAGGLFSWMGRYFQVDDKDRWTYESESDPDGYDARHTDPSERNTDSEGAQGQVSLNLAHARLTAGFDWVSYNIEAAWSPYETEYDNIAAFILGKTRLLEERLILSAGLRYDEYNVEVIDPAGRDEDDDHFSPILGIACLLSEHLKLRVNYAGAFVMPSADQLAIDHTSRGTHYVGNPELDPEKSKTWEGGIDFSYAPFNSSLTWFHTDFRDKIVSVTTTGGDSSWDNLGDATVSGFEGELSCDIGALLAWKLQVKPYLSFTCLTKYEDDETGEDLDYTPGLTASCGLTVSDCDDLSVNLNFAYIGEQNITDYENGTHETIEKGGFTVANFTIGKKILQTQKYGGVTLNGEIQNIFDKDYEYNQGYPMPGRSFFIGMKYAY